MHPVSRTAALHKTDLLLLISPLKAASMMIRTVTAAGQMKCCPFRNPVQHSPSVLSAQQQASAVRCQALKHTGPGTPSKPAYPPGVGFGISVEEGDMPGDGTQTPLQKPALVARLLAAKEASGMTFSEIAEEVGLTNVYCTQLFYGQQQLQPNTVAALRAVAPELEDDDIQAMMRAPMRSFDPNQIQEPSIYRLYEAIMHNGEAVKALINEEFGDGIMSAIDFYCTVDKMEGTQGERRVVITFNGKFLPFVEQRIEDNVVHRHKK